MPSQQKKTNFCKFWLVNQRARGQVSDQQLYNLDYAKKQLILFLIASTYWMGRMGIFYLPFTPFAIRDRNYGTDRSALINVPGASWTSSKSQFFFQVGANPYRCSVINSVVGIVNILVRKDIKHGLFLQSIFL